MTKTPRPQLMRKTILCTSEYLERTSGCLKLWRLSAKPQTNAKNMARSKQPRPKSALFNSVFYCFDVVTSTTLVKTFPSDPGVS